jgi:outer membrane cobalamin receptor
MRWTIILLITVLLHVPSWGHSQTVSLSVKKVSLKKVFTAIKTQTGIVFFYDVALLQDAKPVTVQLKNAPLETALNEIFKGQPLTWVLEDKTITVIKKQVSFTQAHSPAVQPVDLPLQVRGTVTNEEGYPINYVSVLIKGIKRGRTTNNNGAYLIPAHKGDVLVFSSISYITREIKVTGAEINVKLQANVRPMEVLVVGGNMGAQKRKADATAITIIDSKTLEKLPVNTLDQVFRGLVPGTNNYDAGDAPEGFPTLSIRGASSQSSLAIIAVYVDGIEYAGGSGYLSQLDKTNIDRIEIVRGPGAATLYGTGSNGGIVQIFTKKGRPGQTSMNLTTSAGFYKSKWVPQDPFQQLHNLEAVTGYKNVSLTLGGSYRANGAYLPGGGEKNKGFYAGAKFNFGKLQVNMVARYNNRNFTYSKDPSYDTAVHPRTDIIIEPFPGYTTPAFEWFNVKPRPPRNKKGLTETYITGINLSHRTTGNWINNLDAGYTTNSNEDLPIQDGTIPLQRQYVANKNNTATIRYSNVLRLQDNSNGFATVITSGAEYKRYSSSTTFTRATADATAIYKDPDNENYGAFVQANPSYKNVYLTLGMRYEKNKLFDAAWNPRIGLTTNFDSRSLTFKPKISWGRGITPPSYENRFGSPPSVYTVVYGNPGIKPQAQQGFDYGLEIYDKKGRYNFEVVRYDNVIKDMIAEVDLGPDKNDPNLAAFSSTNVAEVANNGWEFSGGYRVKRFNLMATFSIMNSTVKDTTGAYHISYLKDKAPGTSLVNLPKHTAGINFTYNFFRLFSKTDKGAISLSLTEVDGVKSVDYLTYTLDVAYGRTPYIPGQEAVGYDTQNSPVFRLGLNADYFITNDLRFFIQGSNILNSYKYEQNHQFPTHGAGWLFGFKYNITKDN